MSDVITKIYEAEVKADEEYQTEFRDALKAARSEIYRLKDIIERTECERDTSVSNALVRIEQLQDSIENLEHTINELRSHG